MTACSDNVFHSSIFLICSVGYELLAFATILTPAGVVSHACVTRFVVLPRVSQEPFYRNELLLLSLNQCRSLFTSRLPFLTSVVV